MNKMQRAIMALNIDVRQINTWNSHTQRLELIILDTDSRA